MQKEISIASRDASDMHTLPSALELLVEHSSPRCSSLTPASFDPDFIARLSDQFADALASNKLETSLSMLAAYPQLALIPCRKALYSALHWSCASPRLAPATRALLFLGCDPLGYPLEHLTLGADAINTPLRWAVSSANVESLQALLRAGAIPTLWDLHEACRHAQGACALSMLRHTPHLDPFSFVGTTSMHCYATLTYASRLLGPSVGDSFFQVQQALAAFEQHALTKELPMVSPHKDIQRL